MGSQMAIGIDIGYSNLCVASGTSTRSKFELFPAGVMRASKNSDLDQSNEKSETEVMVDGRRYIAMVDQDNMDKINRSLNDNYIYSSAYKALFNAVLAKTGCGTIDYVVTGLPVSQFGDAETKSDLIRRLQGIHKVNDNAQVIVKKVEVVPQPFGAYLDALNLPEYSEAFSASDVLVIDPGFFSVDWISVNRCKLQWGLSGSCTEATSRILEAARDLMVKEYNVKLVIERIETALRHGQDFIYLGGDRVNYRPFLKKAAESVADEAMEFIFNSMRSKANDVDFVVLAGGGASLYEEAVKQYFPRSKIVLLKDSVLANSRGYFFYSLRRLERNNG